MRAACWWHLLGAGLLLSACSSPDYPGFSELEPGMYFQLHQLGNEERPVRPEDHVYSHLIALNMQDSVFFDSGQPVYLAPDAKDQAALHTLLESLVDGDSATFIVPGDWFRQVAWTDLSGIIDTIQHVKLAAKVNRVESDREREAALRHQAWLSDQELKERERLAAYLDTNGLAEYPAVEGMYILPKKDGLGARPAGGDVVWMHYKGFFLDGTEFDNTYERGVPFDFRIGDPDQVIRGFEIGIPLLAVGAEAEFIIPSQLAFGDAGSSTGIVPPYTTVRYEIKIVKIN
ncbi:MAG: FKBP-type peptidyl-prolyl cis-trans isomerase [Bacteroidota bacterium]